MNNPTKINIEAAQSSLRHAPIGHQIDYHPSLPTTMQPARTLAINPDVRSGAVVVTEEQTQGRGRLERTWVAPFGRGLLSTTVLKAPHLPPNAGYLPMIAGLAVIEALEVTEPSLVGSFGLKWPNDVLVIRDDKVGKVAGVLAESSFRGDEMAFALLGIGINVNQRQHELPPVPAVHPQPVSLFSLLDREVDRTNLLISLCKALANHVDLAANQGERILEAWRSRLHTLGKSVIINRQTDDQTERFVGVAIDVTQTGELIVEDESGWRQIFSAGDVSLHD